MGLGRRTLAHGVGIMPPVVNKATVPPAQLRAGEHVLYRFLNADAEPIYIGITGEPYNRWQAHLARAPWAREISAIYYVAGLTEHRARQLEREALRAERPRYDRTFKRRAVS
ncbi:GIY-YIG nuclease family protein [Nocardia concava]|uniref:GIY-YIG nuclease family protein n=1 Tax=Nocardia concava TaxID=257281 RepID=UPI00030CAC85|nr:GIY-YIG nuclease family protein [Nocardia concava]